ncbi:hypothetical protein [Citrobacter arsenatis]|uniref:hypothetical protein n=1 Tax=Citrobacter arsenatis TaxID=2546350 RepID=UPI00300DE4F8
MKTLYFLLLLPFFSNAFNIDSMIKISDKDDFFLVSGNNKGREYVNVTLSELVSDKNNRYYEIAYDASNVTSWPLSAEPSEIIVSSGEQVRVRINKNYKSSGNDRIFGVMFNPDTLNDKNNNRYNIPFGYKAWLVIPGTDPLHGVTDVNKGAKRNIYVVKNDTNKVMVIWADYCVKGETKGCISQLITRPYSEKKIEINSNGSPVEFSFYTGAGNDKKLIKRKIL